MYKLCVIGLGNPGSKYDHTRHNIGKDWLIDLSNKFSLEFKLKSKFEAEVAESHDGSILWIIPSNYVNDSGNTVSKILKSTNLTNENLFVLHDELDVLFADGAERLSLLPGAALGKTLVLLPFIKYGEAVDGRGGAIPSREIFCRSLSRSALS